MAHDNSPHEARRIRDEDLQRLTRATVLDSEGERIGGVDQIYVHDATGRPSWACVRTGLFRTRESLVPLDGVDLGGDEIRVPFTRDVVKNSPRVDSDDHLSSSEEGELHQYYRRHGWQGSAGSRQDEAGEGVSAENTDADRRAGQAAAAGAASGAAVGSSDEREARTPATVGDPDAVSRGDGVYAGTTTSSDDYPVTVESVEEIEAHDAPDEALVDQKPQNEAAVAGGAAGAVPDSPGDAYTGAGREHAKATPRSIGIDDDNPDGDLPGVHHSTPDVEQEQELPATDIPAAAVEPGPHDGPFPGGARADDTGGRRVSDYDEVRDGGYGIGSAAAINDGAQPLGHPIRAWQDTMSFRGGSEAEWERDADVWFMDETAAQNAGFHPAD